ncbi:MAG: hypothetical protein JO296_15715 [Pseudonocardiales bacterium]|nr:hypothetical protein [Pseudonocardiales bacterium]HZS20779.1 hypothetical protein [Pseudonocardiaceae bacterium]
MATRRRASALSATPPDRTAGLDDLGPLPPAPAPLPVLAPVAEDDPDTAPTQPKAKVKRSVRVIAARIPASLFEQLNLVRGRTGDTHEMWFLKALDAVWDELGEHYQPQQESSRVPIPQRRARRPSRDPLAQYPLRLTEEQAEVLEKRARELRPTSMAEFVTTIVQLRLAQLEDDDGARSGPGAEI